METNQDHVAPYTDVRPSHGAVTPQGTMIAGAIPNDVDNNNNRSLSDEAIKVPTTVDVIKADDTMMSVNPSRHIMPIKEHEESKEPVTPNSTGSEIVASVFTFHVDSDLVIPVKTTVGLVQFKVSSANLAFASPVWRSILYGNDTTRSDMDEWVVHIDGDSEALNTIFHIIHYKFDGVPALVNLDELYEIVVVTSQYKCTHLVYPWASKWLQSFSSHARDVDCHHNCHKAILIAWVLGDVQLFRDMTDALTVSSKLDADGQLVNVDGKPLNKMVLPHGLLDVISSTRLETISKMLEALDAPLKQSGLDGTNQKSSFCKLAAQQKECEAMMLGSAIPTMVTAGIFPIPEASKFLESIEALKWKIESINPITYVGKDWKPHLSHCGCNLGYKEAVVKCLKEMPVPLRDDYMEHLLVQAKISGVNNGMQLDDYLRRRTPTPPHRPASLASLYNSQCYELAANGH